MTENLVVVISSGKEAVEKAKAGMMYTINAKRNGWMDDVKLVFFGPSEELIADEHQDTEFKKLLQTAREVGLAPMACRSVSERSNITEKLELMGLDVEYIGSIISTYIKKGYQVLVF